MHDSLILTRRAVRELSSAHQVGGGIRYLLAVCPDARRPEQYDECVLDVGPGRRRKACARFPAYLPDEEVESLALEYARSMGTTIGIYQVYRGGWRYAVIRGTDVSSAGSLAAESREDALAEVRHSWPLARVRIDRHPRYQ